MKTHSYYGSNTYTCLRSLFLRISSSTQCAAVTTYLEFIRDPPQPDWIPLLLGYCNNASHGNSPRSVSDPPTILSVFNLGLPHILETDSGTFSLVLSTSNRELSMLFFSSFWQHMSPFELHVNLFRWSLTDSLDLSRLFCRVM